MSLFEQLIEILESFGAVAQLIGLVLVVLRAIGLNI